MVLYDFTVKLWFPIPRKAREYILQNYSEVTSIVNHNGCTITGVVDKATQTAADNFANNVLTALKNKFIDVTITPR